MPLKARNRGAFLYGQKRPRRALTPRSGFVCGRKDHNDCRGFDYRLLSEQLGAGVMTFEVELILLRSVNLPRPSSTHWLSWTTRRIHDDPVNYQKLLPWNESLRGGCLGLHEVLIVPDDPHDQTRWDSGRLCDFRPPAADHFKQVGTQLSTGLAGGISDFFEAAIIGPLS